MKNVKLSCGSPVTAPVLDQAGDPTTEQTRAKYRYLVWLQNSFASLNSNMIAKGEVSGQQLKIAQVNCNADGSYELIPADSNRTDDQAKVHLTVAANDLKNHLFAVYLNTDNAISVPVYISKLGAVQYSDVSIESDTFDRNAKYGSATGFKDVIGAVTLTKNAQSNKYEGQLIVDFPRWADVQNAILKVGTKNTLIQSSSNESTESTSRLVYDIKTDQGASEITFAVAAVTGLTLSGVEVGKPPAYSSSDADKSPAARLTRFETCTTVAKDARGVPTGCANSWNNPNSKNWNQDYSMDTNLSDPIARIPFATNTSGSTPSYSGGAGDVNSKNNGQTLEYNGSTTGAGVRFYTDVIPYFRLGNTPYYNAMLSTLTVNGQKFAVRMPTPCVPDGAKELDQNDSATKTRCLAIWRGNEGAYQADRQMLLGGQNFPGKDLLAIQVTSGALAGATIRVTLVDARSASDPTLLAWDAEGAKTVNTLYVENTPGSHQWVGESDVTRWRFRYKVEILGIRGYTFSAKVNFDWNTQMDYRVSQMYGVVPVEGSGVNGIQFYGHNNDAGSYTQNGWYYLCQYNDTTSEKCTWTRMDMMPAPSGKETGYNYFKFVVMNGFSAPNMTVDGSTDGVTLNTDETGYVNAKVKSYEAPSLMGSQKYFAARLLPLSVTTTPATFDVTYADGAKDLTSDAFPATTVDPVVNTSIAVSSDVPDLGSKVFASWTFQGLVNGQWKTIKEGVNPGENLSIEDLRFPDGSRALTDAHGNVISTKFRLVASATSSQFSKVPAFYPVARALSTGGTLGTVFSYRAVAGLTASLDDSVFTTYPTYQDENGRNYSVNDATSVKKIDTLPAAGSDPRLNLMYDPEGARVSFTKTVDGSPWGQETKPGAGSFSLTLTSGSKSYTIANGAQTTVPAGTYTMSESSSNTAEGSKWRPSTQGYVCTQGSSTNIVKTTQEPYDPAKNGENDPKRTVYSLTIDHCYQLQSHESDGSDRLLRCQCH